MYEKILHLRLVILIYMGLYFIKWTSSHSWLSLLFYFILKYWCCVILVMLYLDAGSTNHIYKDMQKYIVIVIINIYWDKTSEKVIHDSIFIIWWRNICMVYIREEVIPNPLFHSSRKLLVILIIYSNMDFVDTREVFLIGP